MKPTVTDEELLAACRAGGPRAHRLYRRSVLEWRERNARWKRERMERAVFERVDEVAGVVRMAVMIRRGLSGG